MGIFNYILKPVEECALPGNPKSVAWFWITDSDFYITLGNVHLFESSAERQEKYGGSSPYLDYQYARLLEDLFDILPDISTGIPNEIFQHINTIEKFEELHNKLYAWYDDVENPTEEQDEVFDSINHFLWFARLDTGYLRFRSRCYFYHIDNKMIIRYDFRDNDESGCPVWSASTDDFIISYSNFIAEIESLLLRFFHDMDAQVAHAIKLVNNNMLYSGYEVMVERDKKKGIVKTAAEYLMEEHQSRKEYFWGIFNKLKNNDFEPEIDWNKLKSNIDYLQTQT